MSTTQDSEESKIEPADYKLSKCEEVVSLVFKPGVLCTFPLSYFQHLHELTYLGLSGNNLVQIEKELFIAFPRLTWLDLRNNKLSSFPRFVNHENLETILLGSNNIKRLPIELGSFMQLSCLQASENPLEFPTDTDFPVSDCDIITFLSLCWQQKTEKPNFNFNNKQQAYQSKVSKKDCLQPVKHFRNVSNVLVDKIKSNNPVDQVLAEHVVKKMRNIEKQLQKSKDREALKSWRERYMGRGVARRKKEKNVPFGMDEEFLKMMSRNDLNNIQNNPRMKKMVVRIKKPGLNIDEELKKIQHSLTTIKNHNSNTDFAHDISQKLFDLNEISELQKKNKDIANGKLNNEGVLFNQPTTN